MAEVRNIVHKKKEVEVVPGVNFVVDSAIFFFCGQCNTGEIGKLVQVKTLGSIPYHPPHILTTYTLPSPVTSSGSV